MTFASVPALRLQPVKVVDFGSGKGYLTFAIHDYLRHSLQAEGLVTGVELREDMVTLCNNAAQRLEHPGLTFQHGDVRSFAPTPIDVMIALHACDIATDYAIHMGIRSGAAIIMCSPCCHKQIRLQIQSPALLKPMLQYGLPRAIGLFILSFIPVVNLIAAPLWLLFGVWMMAIQYIDYPADNHKLGWNEMLAWLRQKRWQSMSFGGIVYLVLLVPVVNLLMMPAAVAGATLFWVREQGAEAMAKS